MTLKRPELLLPGTVPGPLQGTENLGPASENSKRQCPLARNINSDVLQN